MEIAAALLAGGATFFAGFCIGLLPPTRPFAAKTKATLSAGQDKFFEKFLNYDGELKP